MERENKNKKSKSTGLADWLHFVESAMDAKKDGRIVVFGHGRLTTHKLDNTVEITAKDIKDLIKSDNENTDSI